VIPKNVSFGNTSGYTSNNTNNPTNALPSKKKEKSKPQIPMEHDGGVLCMCPIPDNYLLQTNTPKHQEECDGMRTHRFLSGGADSTVKLWEVNESPLESGKDNNKSGKEMVPRLVRTYRGHSGYVHSIAVLGTLFDPTMNNNINEDGDCVNSDNGLSQNHRRKGNFARRTKSRDNLTTGDDHPLDKSFKSVNTASSGDSRGSGGRSNLKSINMAMKSMRRISHLSNDSSDRSDRLKQLGMSRRRLLFVSASRDNTLRIWPIGDTNEHEAYFEDESKNHGGGNKKESSADPFAKGMKLRGHQFGKNNIAGVLCVCAVPSFSPDDTTTTNGSIVEDDTTETDGTISAGQFCSGGSDGLIRVWDVRSALTLGLTKVPKAGMYGAVQLQCINPQDPETVQSGGGPPAPITSLVCTHCGVQKEQEVALFAGDASGTIRRYSRMNESGTGHVNSAIWWICTGMFAGHTHPITGMSMLSSPMLLPLLCPNVDIDVDDEDIGTMLVSSCKDGSICVWDAFDARIHSQQKNSYEKRQDDQDRAHGRIPKRAAMWEIELNDGEDLGAHNGHRSLSNSNTTDRPSFNDRVGITSITTLPAGTLMVAGTTDGAIRMWNVSSGLYEGAYNLGKYVQIWSLGVLSEQDIAEECDDYGERKIHSAGIIVSGDNRGRIRVLGRCRLECVRCLK